MDPTDLIPFLNAYPFWARVVVLGCGATIAAVLVLTPRKSEPPKPPPPSSAVPQQGLISQNAATINNVYQGGPVVATPEQAHGPILRFGVEERDIQIKWPRSELLPTTYNQKAPLALVLKNIGGQRAIDIELSFNISVDTDMLRAELESAQIFPGWSKDDTETFHFPLERVLGTATRTRFVGFGGTNIKRVATLNSEEGKNSITVALPPALQNMISIIMLSKSYAIGKELDKEMTSKSNDFMKLLLEKNQDKMYELFKNSIKKNTSINPDISIAINYSNQSGAKHSVTETIRSLYQVIVPPHWIFENEHRETLFFDGGLGVLSFEDKENPDEGFYNLQRR